MVIETWSPKETYALGEKIGREALPGQVYTLNGDLGVGKTVFTQGCGSRTWYTGAGEQSHLYDCAGI